MLGTRGVPAAYGGFETAVEEIGSRLVTRGHDVVVYCRRGPIAPPATHLGMRLVHLPALRMKVAETLSHTALSSIHAITHRKPDAAFVFNAANAPFLPLLRARGIPIALHMDGLEWRRAKWNGAGQAYYQRAEAAGVRLANALIADAQGIADYYQERYGAETELLSYGAPIQREARSHRLDELGLRPGGYHLVVARFEPENHVTEIVRGYAASTAELPLVVVGSAPYAADYVREIETIAAGDPRIKLLGGIWDQELLDQLYAHALEYLHGHSVGGTNPSLLRAMGAGTAITAFDVDFNREVAGALGRYFADSDAVRALVSRSESDRAGEAARGSLSRDAVAARYNWDLVTDGYEQLAVKLASGVQRRVPRVDAGPVLRSPAPTEVEAR